MEIPVEREESFEVSGDELIVDFAFKISFTFFFIPDIIFDRSLAISSHLSISSFMSETFHSLRIAFMMHLNMSFEEFNWLYF